MPLTLDDFGARVYAWRVLNFGEPSAMRNALQICEESGEVARAVGKAEERIRPETRGNLADELGDVLLAVCGMAANEGIDLQAIAHQRLVRMEGLDFRDGSPIEPPSDSCIERRKNNCAYCSHGPWPVCLNVDHDVQEWRALFELTGDDPGRCPGDDDIPF